MNMRRIGLVAAWVLATALAMAIASQAVALVADRAVELRVDIPILDQSVLESPTTADPNPPTSVNPPATATTLSTAAPSPVTTTQTTTASGTSTTSSGQTTTTTAPISTTTTTLAVGTVTTTTTTLASGSFAVTGGHVTAICTGQTTIQLLGAVPLGGWSLDVESAGPDKVRVDFESGEQESEIEIVCRNGQLQAEISD